MNYYERPTPLQEQAYTEARHNFAEHLKQFKANCDAIHNIECPRSRKVFQDDAGLDLSFSRRDVFIGA